MIGRPSVFRHLEPALCLALSSQSWTACWTGYTLLSFFSLGFYFQPHHLIFLYLFFLTRWMQAGLVSGLSLVDVCSEWQWLGKLYLHFFLFICPPPLSPSHSKTRFSGYKVKMYCNTALKWQNSQVKPVTSSGTRLWSVDFGAFACTRKDERIWWLMLHSTTEVPRNRWDRRDFGFSIIKPVTQRWESGASRQRQIPVFHRKRLTAVDLCSAAVNAA